MLVEIETDKVVLEIVAPADGTLQQIIKNVGDVVLSEEVVGLFSRRRRCHGECTGKAVEAAAEPAAKAARR